MPEESLNSWKANFYCIVFTARRYASAVLAVVVRPSVRMSVRMSVRHTPVLYHKSWLTPTERATRCVTPSRHRAVHKAGR